MIDAYAQHKEMCRNLTVPLKPKMAIYMSYIRPSILHESEAWCLNKSEMVILQRTERFMVRAMC